MAFVNNSVWHRRNRVMMRPILGRPATIVPPSEIQIALLTDYFFLRQAPQSDHLFRPSFSTTDSVLSSDFSTTSSSSPSSPSRSEFSTSSFPCNYSPPAPNYLDDFSNSDVESFPKVHATSPTSSPSVDHFHQLPFKAQRFPSRSFSTGSACSSDFSAASSSSTSPSPHNDADDFCREFAQYLLIGKKPKTTPAQNYICHICYKSGHYIQNCPKKTSYETHTPYQGVKPCFGQYKCPKCKRKWISTKSYAELKQECKKCKIGAFPYKQMRLDVARTKGLLIEK